MFINWVTIDDSLVVSASEKIRVVLQVVSAPIATNKPISSFKGPSTLRKTLYTELLAKSQNNRIRKGLMLLSRIMKATEKANAQAFESP